ncbi:PEP-CTERM sorting domain-containing protein [Nostocaceae cyanobacterium CENA357]|uniref:PEP-CTERM sorting domain-containing protein n=1 Tax=Atlanticothrix silvestris CENA357 TaxID=1725252 RepID=A0A8J7H5V5_9CYAN|nr:PEP-CTERM sorting domain-containing protein [Atlanticothrix silvestris]MBH8551054.1 PEP-CTERM sorting domain-containing protein [Atlanticothrix silvestris CENA357]
MKLIKKLSIIAFSFTTTLVSTAVITGIYIPVAQAQYDPNYVLNPKELVFNGGFELDPLVDPNNPDTANPNVTGWTKIGDAINASGTRISNFPQSGNQGLSLGGFVDLSYISQTLSTQPGQKYELSYYLASIAESPDLDNQFQTFVDGNKIFDQNNISFQPYTPYKFNFTADASSTELKFGNVDKYAFLYLDNVSVKPVPEPSTIGGIAVAVSLGIWLKKKRLAINIKSSK